LADDRGRPVAFALTPGNVADVVMAVPLLAAVAQPKRLLADKAYDADSLRRWLKHRKIRAAIPSTASRRTPYPTGTRLFVIDESGVCSSTNTITISPNRTDDIEGANSPAVIATAPGYIGLESNGASAWFITDQLAAASAPHGAFGQFLVKETLLSGLSGATVTTTNFIPANCIVFALSARVVTTITGATSYEVGETGNLSEFGSLLSLPAGPTNFGLIGPKAFFANTNVLLTAAGSNFTAGAVRLSLVYMVVGPSTS
jgi:Transposase DDE domain